MASFYVPPELVPAKAFPKLPRRASIEDAIETLIAILDASDADSDFEELGAEDSFQPHGGKGAGCPVADPDGEHDGCEPDSDDEIETWSHPDDHPAELFIGRRRS